MNNILIITSRCYEDARQDGLCGKNLKDSFDKINESIFLLGYTSKRTCLDSYKFLENEFCFYHEKIKQTKFSTITKLFKPFIDNDLVKKYFDEANKIIQIHNINTIVATLFPLEAVIAATLLKKKYSYLTIMDYEIDSGTDSDIFTSKLGKYHKNAYIKFMFNIYKQLDYSLIMKYHEKHTRKVYGKSINEKIKIVDIPILVKPGLSTNKNIKDTIDFFYTGSLDIDAYSPQSFFDFFEINKDKQNWRLHLYTRGNCEELIKQYADNDNRIIQHGYVDVDILNREIENADIFLNIEHTKKVYNIPSKALMYFGYGKPVIHFGDINSYSSKEYMCKYPLCLIVNPKQISNDNNKIVEFISNNKGKFVNFDAVAECLPMNEPKYSRDLIMTLLANRCL